MKHFTAIVRGMLVLCALLFALFEQLLLSPAYAEAAAKPEVWYFYENYCDSCKPDAEFAESFDRLTGEFISGYQYYPYNVTTASGMRAYQEAVERFQIEEARQLLPLAIVDGQVYSGSTAIQSAMPADFLAREPSTDSVVYYLYIPLCESCAKAERVLDALPAEVTVHRGDFSFASKVIVERIDLSGNLAAAQALFEKYNVPEDRRMAPIAFVRDRYYQGADDIERYLELKVAAGGAVGVEPVEAGTADLSAVSWLGSAAAGLVGGLNPCALSMLLLFLTMIVAAKRSVKLYATTFLISKFVVYLLIGDGLYGVLGSHNPLWIRTALRWGMTVFGGILAAVNVADAVRAWREQYGKIRNQLPSGLRRLLQDRIRTMLSAPGARFAPIVAVLGALVAAGEFLCAGQVYLAALIAAADSGIRQGRAAGMMLVYCAAFLTPSALLSILAGRGRAMFELSEWVRGRMAAIKLITAVALVAILIWMWIA